MKFSYYGHSCFLVESDGIRFLFDPFISPNPKASSIDVNSIEADYILISHGHFDHIADAEAIAKRTGATVVCAWEIYEWLTKKGVENIRPMNTGGAWKLDWGVIRCTIAHHSSGLPDGTYGGNPMGFTLETKEGVLHYSGDTALTLDMQLVGMYHKPDWVILPIGDNFTMGYQDALRASTMMQCKRIIGVHFDTFGFIEINHQEVQTHFESDGVKLHLPAIGDSIELTHN
jgi:L-ascorbate metabolism protein UlaG (beta-lactamase superfamily)